ncbi:hypothetical protein D3C72_1517900 [compost metagenome]
MPAPTYRRVPSYSCITEPWPLKPRADSDEPPLPGAGEPVMPVARLAASTTDTSPRARIASPVSTSMLAGVSSGVRPRRLPVCVGSSRASGVWRLASTCTGVRLGRPVASPDWASTGPQARPSPSERPERPERRARCRGGPERSRGGDAMRFIRLLLQPASPQAPDRSRTPREKRRGAVPFRAREKRQARTRTPAASEGGCEGRYPGSRSASGCNACTSAPKPSPSHAEAQWLPGRRIAGA